MIKMHIGVGRLYSFCISFDATDVLRLLVPKNHLFQPMVIDLVLYKDSRYSMRYGVARVGIIIRIKKLPVCMG
jgi:hypothetical protein